MTSYEGATEEKTCPTSVCFSSRGTCWYPAASGAGSGAGSREGNGSEMAAAAVGDGELQKRELNGGEQAGGLCCSSRQQERKYMLPSCRERNGEAQQRDEGRTNAGRRR